MAHVVTDTRKRVLVACLNWGLGHATRCIPIIRRLESKGVAVWLASDGVALHLLRAEFPHLPAFPLPSYNIQYFSENMVWNIARQMPRLLYAIRTEQWHTRQVVKTHNIQGVISDNRYGCFTGDTQNVLLTHQLNLRIPQKPLEWAANKVLRKALAKFGQVWVPDTATNPSLSGELSHPANRKGSTTYIGLLSRMHHDVRHVVQQEYDVAVVLSGPEPQRTLLEQMLLEQAMSLPQRFIFIQGKTSSKTHYFTAENVEVVSYLTSYELQAVLHATKIVVCRSGYSSLMDLVAMGKPAILIPTPGQTEQEYLATRLARHQWFVVQTQQQIDLKQAIKQVEHTMGVHTFAQAINQFEPMLDDWLHRL
jgi:uncharacterized protein (TIGR00661 family)